MKPLPEKICGHCGRLFSWRKKWERCWAEVRFCSERCRRAARSGTGSRCEEVVVDLLRLRKGSATICPSEAARALAGAGEWRDWMEPIREAARRLARRNVVVITQRGAVVDPGTIRGPIRLGRGPEFPVDSPSVGR